MPTHPQAERARKLFDSLWVDGDMQTVLDAHDDDFVWINDIGAGPFREVRGKDAALAMQMWWFEFFDGTFRHELIDICASDDRVIEVLREVGEKDGHVFDNLALYVYEIGADGRYSSLRTFDRDRENIDAFWAAYPEVLAMDTDALLGAAVTAAQPG